MSFGAEVAAGVGQAFNIANQVHQTNESRKAQKRQLRHQRNLNEQGHHLGKKMFDYTNFPMQMERMKKEGLNIGLMYGQSGPQGGTASSPSGGSAGS